MQNLKSRLSLLHAACALDENGRRNEPMLNESLQDAHSDLDEADFLLADLKSSCTKASSVNTNFLTPLLREIGRVQRHIGALRVELNSLAGQTNEACLQVLRRVRTEFLSLKSDIRKISKQKGCFVSLEDWQSPVYKSSCSLNRNHHWEEVAEHIWDYKRDGHLDALEYERLFRDEYCSHLGAENTAVYLTSSGMAAFSTVLSWLRDELSCRDGALAVVPMYFENLHLLRASFPALITVQGTDSLSARLELERPSLVFCDAVSNSNQVLGHELDRIFSWARKQVDRPVFIVIDTTCLPLPVVASSLLEGLPSNVGVIFVESLAKHHQYGMDLVTGGAVVLCAEISLQDSFRKTRARLGGNIVDTSVGSLPSPSKVQLLGRLARHSRNTKILCEGLEQIAKRGGLIESVSWLDGGTSSADWFVGTCFTIHLRKEFRSISLYQEFEHRVFELCQARGVRIAFSTSFGFDVSRIYVTAPSTRFEDPFLRVSVGTESVDEVSRLLAVLDECNGELFQKWSLQVNPSFRRKSEKSALTLLPNKAGFARSDRAFFGETALSDYLSPANYAPSPMVELPYDLNPFKSKGVRLMAKIVPLVPLMNIKSIPAFAMLDEARGRGELDEVANIIESSSSNTVLSLSVMARLFGINNTKAIVDHSIAPGLMRMLRLFGIEILLHPGPGHESFDLIEARSQRARELGAQSGWFNPGQYSNPDNPSGFEKYLAPEIWKQTDGKIDLLACALGTCGTMVGVSRGLRQKKNSIKVLACCPAEGEPVPGPRQNSQLGDVTFDWQNVADVRLDMPAKDSFAASVALLRRGIMAGPSSGMNYAGALRFLEDLDRNGNLEPLIESSGGELNCVVLCCDSPLPHVDEYFKSLGDDFFPIVHPVPEVKIG